MNFRYFISAAIVLFASAVYGAGTNEISKSGGENIVGNNPTSSCDNVSYFKLDTCPLCPKLPCSSIKVAGGGDNTTSSAGSTDSTVGPMSLVQTSFVDNIFANHHHYAVDYQVGRPSGGCSTCGGSSLLDDKLMNMYLERRHRYRETSRGGSFGPGVFSNFDIRLDVFRDNDVNVIDLFDPTDLWPTRFVDGVSGDVKDGIFYDKRSSSFIDLRVYDGSNNLVTDINNATSAVLKSRHAIKSYFDIVDIGGRASVPVTDASPWRKADVGRVARLGDTTYNTSTGAFSISASGRDIWNQQDEFHYAFQSLHGDGTITARVTSLVDTDPWAKAGVMLRDSLADGSRFAMMGTSAMNGAAFQRRTTAYNEPDNTSISEIQAPYWLKVVRSGGTYTGYQSPDGTNWVQMYSINVTMASSAYIGLCVTSHNNSNSNTATFDNITVTGGSGTWANSDIGSVGIAGTASLASGTYTVHGSGSDIWGSADQCQYVYQTVSGDCEIKARVVSLQNTDGWAKAGLMIRESLSANAVNTSALVSSMNGTLFQWRGSSGGSTTSQAGAGTIVPYWVRLTRSGSTITGYGSTDGTNWRQVGSLTMSFGTDVFVGLACTSHRDGTITTAAFDNVTLSGTQSSSGDWPSEGLPKAPVGRLTKIEDRNGYATTITYKSFTTSEIEESPSRQLQIDTITDPHGRVATFTYNSTQQSGLWCISRIDLPNSQHVDYSYSSGKLSGVAHPDGTASSFTYGYNSTAQCTTVAYDDVSAEGSHRRKTAYLTNNVYVPDLTEETAEVVNQSSLMIRMITNGNDEVTYLNTTNPHHISNNENLVYEGSGKIRLLHAVFESPYYKDGWLLNTPSAGYDGISGTKEDTFPTATTADTDSLRKGKYATMTDAQGLTCSYTYDDESFVTQKTYPDSTTEQWSYNTEKLITRYKDRLNRVTKYTYDGNLNMLTKEVGILYTGGADTNQSEHATYTYEYYGSTDTNKYLLKTVYDADYSSTYSDVHRTDYAYNSSHLLTSITEGADTHSGTRAQITFSYDSYKRLHTMTDAEGRATTYDYDARDRLVKITYADSSTERFIFGSSADANLLVKYKDRNGNVTKYEYDNSGRRTKTITAYSTMDLSDSETVITDVAVKVEETCTYLAGTDLKLTCLKGGDLTENTYDYRHRVKSVTKHPKSGVSLTTTNTYVNNLLFCTEDPYGRKTYYNYRNSDSGLIRTVRGTMPSYSLANFSAVAAVTRDSSDNAAYLVEDTELDDAGQWVARVDGRNIRHTMSYDSRARLIESIEAKSVAGTDTTVQGKMQFEYDANSNRTRIKHPRTFTESANFYTEFTYNGRNLVASQIEAAGRTEAATTSFTYFLDKKLKDTTDGRNNVWSNTYKECCGRLSTKAAPVLDDSKQPITYYGYDAFGNTTHIVQLSDVSGVTSCCSGSLDTTKILTQTTTKYDARNRPIAQTVWLDATGTVDETNPPIYGDSGAPSGKTGLTTRWRYDDNLNDGVGLDASDSATPGGYTTELGSLGIATNSDFSAVEVTNPAGEKTVAVYDGVGRLVRTIDGNKNYTTTSYDVMVSNLAETTVTDPLSHTNKSHADGAGRVRETLDADSRTTTYGFDANSNRVSMRDPNSTGFDYQFDYRNREKQRTDTATPTASFDKTEYDASSNIVKTTDPSNKDTTFTFDPRNRKITITDRISGVTTFEYDKNNNLTKIIDADANAGSTGKFTQYTYDQRNLLATEVFPDHNPTSVYDSRTYQFDGANRLISRLDQNNDTTNYSYDLASRLTGRIYPDSNNDTFSYDAASRLISAASARYSNTITRDYASGSEHGGRLKSETLSIGGSTYTVNYAYDDASRQTSVTYPNSDVVTRTFTNRNQLYQLLLNSVSVAERTYDNGLRLYTTSYGNGLVETRTYRNDNCTASIGITGVTDFTYSWDANKRKTAETDGISPPSNSQSFGYDYEDRLTSFTRGTVDSLSWTLSKNGDWSAFTNNGSTVSRTHNSVHALIAVGTTSLSYDLKGNLATHSNGQTYTWDYENRMASATIPAIPNPVSATYTYDALGRRVSKTFGGTTTIYVSDALQTIAEYENGSLAREYVFGEYIDEPLAMKVGSTKTYFHANVLCSIATLTDGSGNVVERYTYDPYGTRKIYAPDGVTVRATSAKSNQFGYTGRVHEEETGLIYCRSRMYSAELGKWLSRDLRGYHGGFNLYEYCRSSPALLVDPLGTHWQWTDSQVSFGLHPAQYLGSLFLGQTGYELRNGYWYHTQETPAQAQQSNQQILNAITYYFIVMQMNVAGADYSRTAQRQMYEPPPTTPRSGNNTPPNNGNKEPVPPGNEPPQAPQPPEGPSAPNEPPQEPIFKDPNIPEGAGIPVGPKYRVPVQIAPTGKPTTSNYVKISSETGEYYEKSACYDKCGRLIGITDRTTHGRPMVHPEIHHHEFNPITGEELTNPATGTRVFPGEFQCPQN